MSKFYALEMAAQVAKHPHIAEKKGLLGLWTSVVYQPTGSKVGSYCNIYDEASAASIKQIMQCPDNELDSMISQMKEWQCCDKGNYRLELCISGDAQFIAMHLTNSDGREILPIRYFEGKKAALIDSLLA